MFLQDSAENMESREGEAMIGTLEFLFHGQRQEGTCVSMHQHGCYELVYYRTGRGTTRLADITYDYEPFTFTLIQPNTWHDERRFEETEVIFVGFHVNDASFSLGEGIFQVNDGNELEVILLAMEQELHDKKSHYRLKLNLLVSELVVELMRVVKPERSESTDEKLIYTRNFMNEHFNQKLNIESLAAMAGYSYDRFRHLFKETYGVSPGQYVLNRRIEHASRLLRHSRLSVTAIAMECGFSNDSQLCTIFKRETGEKPRTYRERHQGHA
jgi:AraC-like DNA-binding protein